MIKILNNKKGSMMLLMLGVVMCVFIPITAVIYDLGMMRIYKLDIKNAQEIAGLACIGASTGSIEKSVGSGSAVGGFDITRCKLVATSAAKANLQSKTLDRGVTFNNSPIASSYSQKIFNARINTDRLVRCSGSSKAGSAFSDNFVKVTPNKQQGAAAKGFSVQITGLCYKPAFLDNKLLQFAVLGKDKGNLNFRSEYHLEVAPSNFSAVYDSSNQK